MLTAFKAQALVELKQRDKSKIESVLAHGDRLFVGLNTGSLRVYQVKDQATSTGSDQSRAPAGDETPKKPAQRLTDLLHEEEKFSKRAIQQLAVIKEVKVLVALTDNYVSIHDLDSYTLQEKLEKSRGATYLAATSNVDEDGETGIPTLVSRLAVAVKRKILLWTWRDMEFDAEVQEMSMAATVKSLTWVTGKSIMVGMDPGFSLVDVEKNEITDINKPVVAAEAAGQTLARFGAVSSSGIGYMGMSGWVPRPMAATLANSQVLLAKDVNTLFVDSKGQALEKRQIPWAAAPESIGFSYPYLLALQAPAKGALEIRSPATLTLLQTIPVPGASMIYVPKLNISLAHAGKDFVVASDRVVWRMFATSYEAQAAELVRQDRFDEAISLLDLLEDTLLKDKAGSIREIQIGKAQTLFSQQKYRPALDLFTDAGAPPARVVQLYPEEIAGQLSDSVQNKGTDASDGQDSGLTKDESEQIASPSKKTKTATLRGNSRENDAASVKDAVVDSDAASLKDSKDSMAASAALKQAVLALCSFLAQSRVQIQKYLNFDGTLKDTVAAQVDTEDSRPPFANLIMLPDDGKVDWQSELHAVAKLVDTTLFRAYMFALPSLAGPLFRLDNFCDAEVVEEKLYESGRYNDLIDFLQGKKLHRQALGLLEKFGQNKAEEVVMPALRGTGRTIGYLQQLPPSLIELILDFSRWPLTSDPQAGMQIFLADTENAERLPREKVLAHLKTIDTDLSLRYLEHIILELDDTSPGLHQELIDTYIDKLKSSTSESDTSTYKQKLESFLERSKLYNKSKTIRQIPADDAKFFIPRALVLAAMGSHKQALSIFVFDLHDTDRAEAYCNKLYLSAALAPPSSTEPLPRTLSRTASATDAAVKADDESEAAATIYTTLLSLYLRPPPAASGAKPNWPAALALLSAHGARIPASAALDLVPDELAVAELQSYFRGRMRREVSSGNEVRIVKGLEAVRRVGTEVSLAFGDDKHVGRARRVVVGEEDHCRVCLKRFGNSAVRVWPDGEVVHYGCGAGRRAAGQGQGAAVAPGRLEGMRKATWS